MTFVYNVLEALLSEVEVKHFLNSLTLAGFNFMRTYDFQNLTVSASDISSWCHRVLSSNTIVAHNAVHTQFKNSAFQRAKKNSW